MVGKLNRAMQRKPCHQAMTRARVFADASAAGEVDHRREDHRRHVRRCRQRRLAATEDQFHVARVISDVAANLPGMARGGVGNDVGKRLDLAVRLLLGDGEAGQAPLSSLEVGTR